MEFNHISVLLKECIEGLNIDPEGIYVDGTLGGAGHGYEVCRRLSERGRFIGIDQDEDAIMASAERLSEFGDKVTIIKSNYVHMKQILAEQGIDKVNGILLDLGVSSYQLDTAERGFSYREDASLDKVKEKDVNIPPCWCGDVCKVKVSTDRMKSWTEGRRYFVCPNYAYDRALPTNAYDQPPVSSRSKMLISNVCQH